MGAVRVRGGAAVIEELARERLGFGELRPGQLSAVEGLAGGRDVLAVLPTGGGKSAIYELAGMLRAGPTVVVSPLIALQDDQLAHLRAAGLRAVLVNSQQAAGGGGGAHLISQWGRDFRPDYLLLGAQADALGAPVRLALTATAAPPVRQEIIARLGLGDPGGGIGGFDR